MAANGAGGAGPPPCRASADSEGLPTQSRVTSRTMEELCQPSLAGLGTGSLPSNTVANPKGELKSITTGSGLVLDEPSVLMPPPFILRGR
ncbi:hypothetical protein Tco_0973551 [Tanacetum coccineum]